MLFQKKGKYFPKPLMKPTYSAKIYSKIVIIIVRIKV